VALNKVKIAKFADNAVTVTKVNTMMI